MALPIIANQPIGRHRYRTTIKELYLTTISIAIDHERIFRKEKSHYIEISDSSFTSLHALFKKSAAFWNQKLYSECSGIRSLKFKNPGILNLRFAPS
jgi:hypothetical protein